MKIMTAIQVMESQKRSLATTSEKRLLKRLYLKFIIKMRHQPVVPCLRKQTGRSRRVQLLLPVELPSSQLQPHPSTWIESLVEIRMTGTHTAVGYHSSLPPTQHISIDQVSG